MRVRLFSEIERTSLESIQYAEPRFSYLDKSARTEAHKVRRLLEDWFAEYPESEKAELAARFRSDDDTQFLSSFFELYVYTLLKNMGHTVQVHPDPETKSTGRPDFLAQKACGQDFFVEAVLATDESKESAAQHKRMNTVYETLDKLDSPNFFLLIRVHGAPATPPPGGKIRSQLSRWLKQLDYEEIIRLYDDSGFDRLPEMTFTHDDWEIVFSPIPKGGDTRGNPGVRPIGVRIDAPRWVNSKTSIREAVLDKGGRYGDVNKPFVIALNAHVFHEDDREVMQALIGTETWSIPERPSPHNGVKIGRRLDGAWTTPSGPRYTRVSAVLIAFSLDPWSIASRDLRLWHHLRPKLPYSGALCVLPQAVPEEKEMGFSNGLHPRQIFGLQEGWPEDINETDE